VLVLAGASVQAEITYYFGGTLSQSIGGFDAGTSFTGSFSYTVPSNPYIGGHPLSYTLNVTVGQTSLSLPITGGFGAGLFAQDGELFFEARPHNGGDYPKNNEKFLGFGLRLTDSSQTYISYYHPDDSLRLSMLSSAYIWLSEYSQQLPESEFQLISYTKTQESQSSLTSLVPEPSSLSLLLAGGAVLMAGRRRKS